MRLLLLPLLTFIFFIDLKSQINACAKGKAIHIVVLGSSTAAGSGPSHSDSAWVRRYTKYLQNINPLNQVTNLARGGYNTYKIQADNFNTPNGKPSIDSSRNISQAIRLNADAIIVNMPSNDAASGFGVNEQMSNFIRLKTVADSFNIPLWVCTTQPRNFSVSKRNIQVQTKDSILRYFGKMTIDFWTGFADSTNDLKSTFDSGDGVHMNDTAHKILNQRVIGKLIPNALADTSLNFDLSAYDLKAIGLNPCGDSLQAFMIKFLNLGASANLQTNLQVVSSLNNPQTLSLSSSAPLNACSEDSVLFYLNTSLRGKYRLQYIIQNNDSNKTNDSSAILNFNTIGKPIAYNILDSLCSEDTTFLTISGINSNDHIIWYQDTMKTNFLKLGDSLPFNSKLDTTFYFEVVRGPLHFYDSLSNGTTSTTNWNGIMFDFIAKDSLTIDSLKTKFFDVGIQHVEAYYKIGTHRGFENLPATWTQWGMDTISVGSSGDFKVLDFYNIDLLPSDTLAIYLHLSNSSSRLSYRSSSSVVQNSNSKAEILSGSGVSYTFGTTYSPRNFVGNIYYHFGKNLLGDCSSGIKAYQISKRNSHFNLGPDTIISLSQSLTISLPKTFSNVLWSNGDTTYQMVFSQQNLTQGNNLISLSATDENGCAFNDSINIYLDFGLNIFQHQTYTTSIYPNPTYSSIYFKSPLPINQVNIYNVEGGLINRLIHFNEGKLDLNKIKKGNYIIELILNNSVERHLLIKL